MATGTSKRQKIDHDKEEEDRLSDLHMWTSIPDLNFTIEKPNDVRLFDSVLSCRAADINSFTLSITNDFLGSSQLADTVVSWVARAVDLNVRHVKIKMNNNDTESLFLDELFNHEKLETVDLDLFMPDSYFFDGEEVKINSFTKLKNLQVLKLRVQGKVCKESVSLLLSNCPVIKQLELYDWSSLISKEIHRH